MYTVMSTMSGSYSRLILMAYVLLQRHYLLENANAIKIGKFKIAHVVTK